MIRMIYPHNKFMILLKWTRVCVENKFLWIWSWGQIFCVVYDLLYREKKFGLHHVRDKITSWSIVLWNSMKEQFSLETSGLKDTVKASPVGQSFSWISPLNNFWDGYFSSFNNLDAVYSWVLFEHVQKITKPCSSIYELDVNWAKI